MVKCPISSRATIRGNKVLNSENGPELFGSNWPLHPVPCTVVAINSRSRTIRFDEDSLDDMTVGCSLLTPLVGEAPALAPTATLPPPLEDGQDRDVE